MALVHSVVWSWWRKVENLEENSGSNLKIEDKSHFGDLAVTGTLSGLQGVFIDSNNITLQHKRYKKKA